MPRPSSCRNTMRKGSLSSCPSIDGKTPASTYNARCPLPIRVGSGTCAVSKQSKNSGENSLAQAKRSSATPGAPGFASAGKNCLRIALAEPLLCIRRFIPTRTHGTARKVAAHYDLQKATWAGAGCRHEIVIPGNGKVAL